MALHFELVTPEKLLRSEDVQMVVVPGTEGDFGVMEGHAPYMSTLWHGGKVVGETTSGNFGYRTGKSIALGMLRADLAEPGTEIEVEIYGDRFKAIVQPDGPLFDPSNERLRA